MIDDHVHLWDQDLVRRSASARKSLAYFRTPLEALPQGLEDLVEDLAEAGVERAFLLAMDCRESGDGNLEHLTVRNEAVAAAVDEHPDLLVAFGSVDPRRGGQAVVDLQEGVATHGLVGLKFHASALAVYPHDKALMYPIYERAQELDLPIIHHTGTTSLGDCLIEYSRPLHFDRVAQDFPDLRILLAHFGWPWSDECFAVLMRRPNLYTDISGWAPRYIPDNVVRMINGPLKDRTLAGSDYPMIKPAAWLEDFRESLRPRLRPGVEDRLLRLNALAFLEGT